MFLYFLLFSWLPVGACALIKLEDANVDLSLSICGVVLEKRRD